MLTRYAVGIKSTEKRFEIDGTNMRLREIAELVEFIPLTEGGYAIVPKGQGIRLPYVSHFPPLEKPWHGYRTDCSCRACKP